MLFFKNVVKKTKIDKTISKENSIKEKGMTINRLKNALEVAVRKYTYSFDRHFMLTFILYDYVEEIKIEVRLKDDKHELIACSMCIKEKDVTDETIVVWRQKGPWCKIIENKVKHIEETYQYMKKEEQKLFKRNAFSNCI